MKLGLVLEGGASRAFFSIGAMDALLELEIYTDYLIGVSAGIAYGVSYVARQKGRCLELGEKFLTDKRYMGMKYFWKKGNHSYYNINFVFDDIPNKYLPFDYEAFNKYNKETVAVITDIETGKPCYRKVEGNDKKWKLIEASCALPIMFQPVEIDGRKYLDGGICDPIPYKRAFIDGCDKAIVILTRERSYVKNDEPGVAVSEKIYKRYPEFTKALEMRSEKYNECRKTLFEKEKDGKVLIVEPENTQGWKRTEKEPDAIRYMYECGYNYVIDNSDKIKRFIAE